MSHENKKASKQSGKAVNAISFNKAEILIYLPTKVNGLPLETSGTLMLSAEE